MILGIDASNIRQGGGITHLVELLRAAQPSAFGFGRVIVWGSSSTLSKIESKPWLDKRHVAALDGAMALRLWWQYRVLAKEVANANCGILFSPGGTLTGSYRPAVTMCRNMLPFEWSEMRRFGWTLTTLRYMLLRYKQMSSFRKADAVIFLTEYARKAVSSTMKLKHPSWEIIPHGIDARFFMPPRPVRKLGECRDDMPIRILYVSIVNAYKHQWHVASAVAMLRRKGYPIVLDLVGPPTQRSISRLKTVINELDPNGEYIRYHGAVDYSLLHEYYRQADINVFASSCENLPNILLEGMAGGLATASSRLGPMPEVLGPDAEYFDPEDPSSIASALERLINDPEKRAQTSLSAFQRARNYSWLRCANETFGLLQKVANKSTAHIAQ